MKEQDIDLNLQKRAKEKIAEEGYDPEYGARPLRRAIQKHIEDRFIRRIVKGYYDKGQKVYLM